MKRGGFNITLKELDRLKKKGLIKDFKVERIGEQLPGKVSQEKEYLHKELSFWAYGKGLTLETEKRFHPERMWRFDWRITGQLLDKEIKIGVEYNGIMSAKSRHTTVTGYTGDMDKINAAQALGWIVLQFTPLNYLNALTELNKCTCQEKQKN